jgi:hypothetical protein
MLVLLLSLLARADEVIEQAELLRCMSLLMAHFGHGAMSDLSPLCEQKRTLQRPSFSVTLGTCLGSSCLLPQIEFFSDGIERKQS